VACRACGSGCARPRGGCAAGAGMGAGYSSAGGGIGYDARKRGTIWREPLAKFANPLKINNLRLNIICIVRHWAMFRAFRRAERAARGQPGRRA
jgi:hypothetical protein